MANIKILAWNRECSHCLEILSLYKFLDRNHCPLIVNIWIRQALREISENCPSNWHSALLFFVSMMIGFFYGLDYPYGSRTTAPYEDFISNAS